MHPEYSPVAVARFWARIDKNGPIPAHRPELGPCWLWTGCCRSDGYGVLNTGEGTVRTHRMAWELAFGPIPVRLHVLHGCDNPPCVRPEHLFLGTQADNVRNMIGKGRGTKGREFPERRGDASPARKYPERYPRGDYSPAHLHPERMPRGDRNGSRTHPERLARGDNHYSRLHPEKLARGDRNGQRLHPERTARGERSAAYLHPESYRGERNGKARLTAANVAEIRALWRSQQASQAELARRYGVGKSTIHNVIIGRTWPESPSQNA